MYLTPETPSGHSDALDLDAGVWWRIRHLLPSDLIAEGITPLVEAVSLRDSNLPPSPEDQHRNALLSERLVAASVAAASPIPETLWSAWRAARADLNDQSAVVAALQRRVDNGEPVAAELADARESANYARAAFEAARAAASDPSARGEWKAVTVTFDATLTGEGVWLYSDLPPSSPSVIGAALSVRREVAARKLRSFLGG